MIIIGLITTIIGFFDYYFFSVTTFGIIVMKTIVYFDCIFTILFCFAKSIFVYYCVDTGKRLNMILKYTTYSIFIVLLILHMIPATLSRMYSIFNGSNAFGFEPLFDYVCIAVCIAVVLTVVALIHNYKNLGLRYTVVLITLQGTTFYSYFVTDNNFSITIFFSSIVILVYYINIYHREIMKSIEQEKELTQKKYEITDMKTKVMLSQVKPHFIYNVLSSIAMLCVKDPMSAKKLTIDFSDYLRNNLNSVGADDTSVCRLEKELSHIQTYLNIEKVRFGDRLNIEYDIKQTDFSVPALSIQPIVENAVKHGICPKPEGGTVKISSERAENGYLICVCDDGVGFNEEDIFKDGKTHIGIENIKKRIKLINGSVKIESSPGLGTKVTVFVSL